MILYVAALVAQVAPSTIAAPPEELVVTARRTGVPVWRVRRGDSTLVMVGTIESITRDTRWNQAALDSTVARSDRVMFPQTVGISASPFQLIGWLAKWKRMAKLPKNQSLSGMLDADNRVRLARLAAQGLAPKDWDRMHPLHLAFKMKDILHKRTGLAPSASAAVNKAIRRHKVTRMPIARGRASPIVRDLFASKPAEHLPCLKATIALSEAGPGELRRRSHAWANRQVPAAVRTPVEAVDERCWPAGEGPGLTADLLTTTGAALSGRGTTVAIIDLIALARRGGLLDRLKAGGATIDGPDWR